MAIALVAAMGVVFWLLAEEPPGGRPARPAGGALALLRVFAERPAAWAPSFY